jgi:flagellar L-ring protein precursor FlgH
MHMRRFILPFVLLGCLTAKEKKAKTVELSPLDDYVNAALSRQSAGSGEVTPGSLWSPASRLTDLGSDLRATQVDDLVTILVTEQASAVVQGATKTQRQSTVKSSISSLAGVTRATGPWQNLANLSTQSQLDGQGATSRSTQLRTTLSARVTHVLPNGYLVVEGNKDVVVNSEHQLVTVRGVVRPTDLSTNNVIGSNQIAQMELKINGKGVVNDAVRRPFILYRILMGLLPF